MHEIGNNDWVFKKVLLMWLPPIKMSKRRKKKTGFNSRLHLISKEQKHISNYINISLTLEQWAISLGKNVEPHFLANRFYKASGGPEDPILRQCLSSCPWAIFSTTMSKGTSLQMHIFNFPWWKCLLRAVRVRLSCEWLKIQNRSGLNLVKTDVISHVKVGDPGLEWWPCHDQGLQHFSNFMFHILSTQQDPTPAITSAFQASEYKKGRQDMAMLSPSLILPRYHSYHGYS